MVSCRRCRCYATDADLMLYNQLVRPLITHNDNDNGEEIDDAITRTNSSISANGGYDHRHHHRQHGMGKVMRQGNIRDICVSLSSLSLYEVLQAARRYLLALSICDDQPALHILVITIAHHLRLLGL